MVRQSLNTTEAGAAPRAAATQLRGQLQSLPSDALVGVLRTLDPKLLAAALRKTDASGDKRRDARNRVLRAGKIIYNNYGSVIDCQIRDISAKGCRLKVQSTAHLPAQFVLQIAGDSRKRACEVSRRSVHDLGVKFFD